MNDKPGRPCGWFLRCENPAIGTVAHPILPPVPVCQRCKDWLHEGNDPTTLARYAFTPYEEEK